MPWLGIKPATLWFTVRRSIHRATPARAISTFFKKNLLNSSSKWWYHFMLLVTGHRNSGCFWWFKVMKLCWKSLQSSTVSFKEKEHDIKDKHWIVWKRTRTWKDHYCPNNNSIMSWFFLKLIIFTNTQYILSPPNCMPGDVRRPFATFTKCRLMMFLIFAKRTNKYLYLNSAFNCFALIINWIASY